MVEAAYTFNPLHEPIIPVLRAMLKGDGGAITTVLDLASGEGDKLPLLREAYGPHAHVVALDLDWEGLAHVAQGQHQSRLAGDAHALPLAAACCDRVVCIAALGSFANPLAALREVRRVLRPRGRTLLVTAAQRWARVTCWPEALAPAYAAAAAHGEHVLSELDLVEPLMSVLQNAGFPHIEPRAFLLDTSGVIDAELPLLPWARLAPLVEPRLDMATRRRCAEADANAEYELCSLTLAAWAST